MLKLVIADDERVIRETISRLIDWESMGIELIGVCRDGIEVYNMILDESPDIVMTDIRMPGLTGLEVVREISRTNRQIQFIFLSGYEEFDYAREAMKYGVKYYLLKPCNEKKLEEAVRQASEDCIIAKKQMETGLRQNRMLRIIHQDALYHLLMEGIVWKEKDGFAKKMEALEEFYGQYLDFKQGPCYLYYVYYLEWKYLSGMLECLKEQDNSFISYGIYVKNILIILSYESGQSEILKRASGEASYIVETEEKEFCNLAGLLEKLLSGIRRFDTIYMIHDYNTIPVLNNQNTLRYMQNIYQRLEDGEKDNIQKCMEELRTMNKEASQPEVLKILGNSLCSRLLAMGVCSIAETAEFFGNVNKENDMEVLRMQVEEIIGQIQVKLCEQNQDYGIVAERVMAYVEGHLSECDLTLKKIAEEHLYMNVDYVSRKFRKATGRKFSQYLTEQRVKRAKELLAEEEIKIQYIAEQVGCGNNPQYFSQIFKKLEGMTPAKWGVQIRKGE